MQALLTVLLALLLVACQRSTDRPRNSPTAPAPTTAAPARPTSAVPPTSQPVSPASPVACGYDAPTRIAQLEERAIREASGLAAGQHQPGVYWTLNDSGNEPNLFAFDPEGRTLGRFTVANARNEDWESLQAGPGRDGRPALYVGDTGDNDENRREGVIYRVPEPELDPASKQPTPARTEPAEALRYVFPDGPRNVEAMLVHPRTGETLLVTKSLSGYAGVYRLPPTAEPNQRTMLEPVAQLDLRPLGVFSFLVTDGSVSPDGRRVILRTYLAGLEYDVPDGASLASIWGQQPRVFALEDTRQGEAITYRADGRALLTVGEGSPARLFQLDWRC